MNATSLHYTFPYSLTQTLSVCTGTGQSIVISNTILGQMERQLCISYSIYLCVIRSVVSGYLCELHCSGRCQCRCWRKPDQMTAGGAGQCEIYSVSVFLVSYSDRSYCFDICFHNTDNIEKDVCHNTLTNTSHNINITEI